MTNNKDTQVFIGTWDHASDENFDEFLKAVGFGMIKRWLAKEIHPRLVISERAGTWTIRAETSLKTKTISFTPGVEFDDTTFDGQNVKSIARFENGLWYQKLMGNHNNDTVVTRFVNEEGLHEEIVFGSIKARRLFKRVE